MISLTATGEASGPVAPITFTNILDFASINLAGTASALVQTDKSDYSPGQSAIITGTGWLAGETVNLIFSVTPPRVYMRLPTVQGKLSLVLSLINMTLDVSLR